MLNQVIVVGRLTDDLKTIETEDGKKQVVLTIAVPRSFKNINGEYDNDFIDCVLWNGIAESTTEYCHKGDLIGIKGRLQKLDKDKKMIVIAEKVTFLSSKSEK